VAGVSPDRFGVPEREQVSSGLAKRRGIAELAPRLHVGDGRIDSLLPALFRGVFEMEPQLFVKLRFKTASLEQNS
jgi:hypothetical protein